MDKNGKARFVGVKPALKKSGPLSSINRLHREWSFGTPKTSERERERALANLI